MAQLLNTRGGKTTFSKRLKNQDIVNLENRLEKRETLKEEMTEIVITFLPLTLNWLKL